ncbi:MAG TPA: septation protein SepH [Jatrophihabitans sp.]|nr:septation protein SepH [Jatrophihabitans sp.]
MQSLRVVGPAADGAYVVLESLDGAERFSLPLDERLRDVSTHETPQPGPAEPGTELTPRQIQTRVRAGESAQSVADDAGVPLERVMRFAFPVLAERSRVVDEARRSRARRNGLDAGPIEFGELIDQRFSAHAINPASVGWDAYRREDGGWTVVAAFSAVEQNRLAKFNFALHTRAVSALDALAADLLSDRPVRALLPQQPDPVTELSERDVRPSPPRLAAVPDPTDAELAEERGGPASPALRPARRQKAHTRPIPVEADDELFDQDALDLAEAPGWHEPPLPFEPAGDPAATRTAAGGSAAGGPAATGSAATDSAATGPAGGEPDDGADARHKRRRGDKPRMPSWDDILLGVRHKND